MSKAQIVKGTFSIGPDIDFSSSTTEIDGFDFKIKTTEVNLSVGAGYYVIDNLEISVGLALISSKTKIDNDNQDSSNGVAFGPAITYKINVASGFYIPVGAALAFNSITNEDEFNDEYSFSGVSYGLFTGIEYIVNNKLGVHLNLGPSFGSLKNDDSDQEFEVTDFGIRTGFTFYF